MDTLGRKILVLMIWSLLNARAIGEGLRLLPTGGATAKIYAPHATEVSIAGSWNDWKPWVDRLTSDGTGWWSMTLGSRHGLKAGATYKFVLKPSDGGELIWKPDPWSRQQDGKELGNSIAYNDSAFVWTDGDWSMPNWNELVIYELHIGTFGRHWKMSPPATLDDSEKMLNHLSELGVNAVEIMPVAEFSGDVDWGYTSAYLYAIEHAYGGSDAFKRFVNSCHRRGIAVLVDVVYNHLGPMDLGLWQFDGWKNETATGPSGGIYFYNDERAQTPWAHTRPNYGLKHVRKYLLDNVMYWLDTMHCDGLRVDGVSFVRLWGGEEANRSSAIFNPDGESLLKEITTKAHAMSGRKLVIAEDLQSNDTLTKATSNGGLGFDSQWDSTFMTALRNELSHIKTRAGHSHGHGSRRVNVTKIQEAILRDLGGGVRRTVYLESHDTASRAGRLFEIFAKNKKWDWAAVSDAKKLVHLSAALVMTCPGVPMIFQGQEFLEDGKFTASRSLDWTKKIWHSSTFKLHCHLVKLRRNAWNVTRGLTGSGVNTSVDEINQVLVMHRWNKGGPGDDTVAVFNFNTTTLSNYQLKFPFQGIWKIAFNSAGHVYGLNLAKSKSETWETANEVDQGYGQSAGITLPPLSCIIFFRKPPVPGRQLHGIYSGHDSHSEEFI